MPALTQKRVDCDDGKGRLSTGWTVYSVLIGGFYLACISFSFVEPDLSYSIYLIGFAAGGTLCLWSIIPLLIVTARPTNWIAMFAGLTTPVPAFIIMAFHFYDGLGVGV